MGTARTIGGNQRSRRVARRADIGLGSRKVGSLGSGDTGGARGREGIPNRQERVGRNILDSPPSDGKTRRRTG